MNRRQYLAAVSFAVTGSLTGCASLGREATNPPAEPQEGGDRQPEQNPSTPAVTVQTPPELPTHLSGWAGNTFPDKSPPGEYQRTYQQSAHGERTKFGLSIKKLIYEYYSDKPRVRDYDVYASNRYDDVPIQQVATTFEDYGTRHNLRSRQVADLALAWVQGLKYTQDKPATGYNEYPRYPLETMVDQEGDCEDTSILLATVFRAMGCETALLLLPDAQHMATGVVGSESIDGAYYEHNGSRYYYVETTGEDWRVGEVPQSVRNAGGQAEVIPINSSAAYAMQWISTVNPESGRVEISVNVENIGKAPTRNAQVRGEFIDQNGQEVAASQSSLPRTAPGNKNDVRVNLDPPPKVPGKLRLSVRSDGRTYDVSTSGLREPGQEQS